MLKSLLRLEVKKAIIALLIITFCSAVWADLGDELILAATNGDLTEVERLLKAGADVNRQDKKGNTALMEAAWYGYTEIAELLIKAGAKKSPKSKKGLRYIP